MPSNLRQNQPPPIGLSPGAGKQRRRKDDDDDDDESDEDNVGSPPVSPTLFVKQKTAALFDSAVKAASRKKIEPVKRHAADAPSLIDQYMMYEHILEEAAAPKKSLIDYTWFKFLVCLVTFANLITLGLEADLDCWEGWWSVQCRDGASNFRVADMAFSVIFITEIVLRVLFLRVRFFVKQSEKPGGRCHVQVFNILDVFVVTAHALDVFLLANVGLRGLKLISVFRVARCVHLVKALHLNAFYRELYLIVYNLGEALVGIFYVLIFLALTIWSFAIIFTLALYGDGNDRFDHSMSKWSKEDYWGSVSKSCITLFQIVTRDKWASSIVRPLVQENPAILLLLIPFICITVLCLLNVIIGLVVETTLNNARINDDAATEERKVADAKVMESLRDIFKEADTDGNNTLEFEELEAAMQKKKVRNRMKMLDIPVKDLNLLFAMLDEGHTGAINIDVFFRGCARMRGPAMSADLHQMSVDLDRDIRAAEKNIQDTEDVNDILEELINKLDAVEVDIVRGDKDTQDPVLMARRERIKHTSPKNSRDRDDEYSVPSPRRSPRFQDKEPRLSARGNQSPTDQGRRKNSLVYASIRSMDSSRPEPRGQAFLDHQSSRSE
jgi:voltage-gated sodium channel